MRASTQKPSRARRQSLTFVVAVMCLALTPSAAQAASGGISPGGAGGGASVPGGKAKIVEGGQAVAPAGAPEAVKDVIDAANRIEDKPYIYGGGHGSFKDKGYDCSGAASYALHGGGLLESPIDSTGMARFGEAGKGRWISVYGAPSHGYIVVAGLRFDTAMTSGDGPGWSKDLRSTPEKYRVRHPAGL